ncbi:TA system antitoxin ParD family protein [Marinicella rhabdoformis]|uniref:TA system antitoxin ParD family protein n=1 Tax=Marinicella rhabdoformis TaxID=2580566 RepID=UPI0015D06EA7
MGIVKIDDDLHTELRKASTVMVRSINAQAAYWIKVGMLAEANPNLSYTEIMDKEMKRANVNIRKAQSG